MDAARAAVERILSGTSAGRAPSLGVRVREVAGPGGQSILVVSGFDDPSVASSGLRAGDVIVAVAGAPVRRTADLQRALWNLGPGEGVALTVQRGGQRFEVRLPLR
jgi:S1-C subfamily serine protease